ncbi:NAD(P)H-binding protein [Streptomyces sp. SID11233]|nr:NAD(P)H-binding protein [Streptomyces sp. SID11233]
MILVTGATGTVGREVVRSFPPGVPLRLMTRNPAAVTVTRPEVEAVAGDYASPDSLNRALRGVRKAFLVTSRVAGDEGAVFLRAARAAGVHHVVTLSAASVTDARADDLITRWQRANEELLRQSGMAWTLLRPRSFMSNCLSWAGTVRSERVVRALYGMSANACVDPRDIAEVAVRALTEDGHEGAAHTLTGPEAISAAEQTRLLAQVLGVSLRFEELAPEEAHAALLRRHPPELADALLSSARRQRDGAKAAVGSGVRDVTGRPARSFAEWAGDHADAFAPIRPHEGEGIGTGGSALG